jgi:hypothetical protein
MTLPKAELERRRLERANTHPYDLRTGRTLAADTNLPIERFDARYNAATGQLWADSPRIECAPENMTGSTGVGPQPVWASPYRGREPVLRSDGMVVRQDNGVVFEHQPERVA